MLTSLNSIDDAARLADTIAAHMPLKLSDKQSVLEMSDITERLEYLMAMMESEIDLLQVEKRIRNRVKKQMEKSQREYYLNEQMKAIQKELGEMDDAPDEHEALKRKIDAAKMPKEARENRSGTAEAEDDVADVSGSDRGARLHRLDAAGAVECAQQGEKDLVKAQEVLDTDHYGLERVKDRILEYLAVQSRVSKIKGRSCVWWGRRAWVKPRWGSRSPKRPAASTCAWRWAACVTKRKSAVTAVPTSVRCRAN